ncbi:MAG: BRCT domain-containing protein, partial [Flavobacteriales bacterium]
TGDDLASQLAAAADIDATVALERESAESTAQLAPRPRAAWGLANPTPSHRRVGVTAEGEVVVVSGVFETMSRDEAKAAVTNHGGRLAGSISSKTTMVLAGEKMGPSKLQKAESLGIPLVDEKSFLARIGLSG